MRVRRCLVALTAAVLVLSGCSAPNLDDLVDNGNGGNAAALGGAADINPQDPATLRSGGNLRLALTSFPPNYNILHIDGNLGEIGAMYRWTLPRAFRIAPDGATTVNHDYFTNVELTKANPQTVVYTINPKAVWSDGTPITWEDIAAQIHATSGEDPDFLFASPNGSERVASVTRGVDDRQAVIVFAKPFTDWRGMFSGNAMLLPKAVTGTAEAFNKGFLTGPGPSAGPFMVSSIDKATQRIQLTRNPRWWGRTPLLDSVTYTVLDDAALIPALQNNSLDVAGIGSLDDLITAHRTSGVVLRRAPAASWYHFTFNGAPGSRLSDPRLRVAIGQAIDRKSIAEVAQHGLVADPVPLNNHIFLAGQEGYQDNSPPFDPDAAARELDALGWKLNGAFREKDGQRLVVRDVFYDALSTRQIALVAQNMLAKVGVQLDLIPAAGGSLFRDYVIPGNFDVVQFSWMGDAFALGSLTQIYAEEGESNFGKIGSAAIDAKIDETLAELDPAKARVLANELDQMLWDIGFSLPLFQSAGNAAYRDTLANYGPAGIGDLDYTIVGFMK